MLRGHNTNVVVALVFYLFDGIATSLWNTTDLPNYIYLLRHYSNASVGLAEGLQGAVQALVALPIGYVTDKFARQRVAQIAGLVGCVASALMCTAVYYKNFSALCAASAVWGCYNAISYVSVEAILADSVETGRRSSIYTVKFACRAGSRMVGPAVALVLFYIQGDSWTLASCSAVLYVGMGLAVVACFFLFPYFSDGHSLGMESEAISAQRPEDRRTTLQTIAGAGQSSQAETENKRQVDGPEPSITLFDEASGETSDNEDTEDVPLCAEEASAEHRMEEAPTCRGCIPPRYVPLTCWISAAIMGLASGMTTKFFPLFFKNECKLSPVWVNLIYIVQPFSITCMSFLAQRCSLTVGRVGMRLLTGYSGVMLMGMLVCLRPYWTQAHVIVPICIIRAALMNCNTAIYQSIMMDYVPKSRRGRWTALGSVASFGWSGSAFVGGLVVDAYGYGVTFLATASLQLLGISCWLLLLGSVREEKAAVERRQQKKNGDQTPPSPMMP